MKREDQLNFGCLGRRAMLAALLFGLAACAGRDAAWQRPGTSEATRSADYSYCRSEAKSLTGPALGIDQDIAASRGGDWQNSGQYQSRMEQNTASDAAAFGSAVMSCMEDKGYRQR